MSDSKERFSDRVQDYVRARPGYPPQIIPLLRREIGLAPDWVIADVGSGTGISSRIFLENENGVLGVEPNAAMRGAAEELLRGFSNFTSIDGSAEATGLPDHACDMIVASQAFHWFDPVAARREFVRVLKLNRYVVLMWNERQKTGAGFLEDYERLLLRFGTDYLKIRHENTGDDALAGFFGSAGFRAASFSNPQSLNLAGLQSRLLSSSYIPSTKHPDHPAMLDELRRIFDRHQLNGEVTIQYETGVYWGRLSGA